MNPLHTRLATRHATRPGTRRMLAAAALLLAAGAAHAADGDTLKKIKDSGVISLGYRESSIPFSYTDGKEVMGYSHEILLQTLAEAGDIETEMQAMLAAWQDGDVDVLARQLEEDFRDYPGLDERLIWIPTLTVIEI